MIVSRRFAEEPTIAFRDQPTTVGHRPSTELRRQAMPTNAGVRVFYMPPPSPTTIPPKRRAAVAAAAAAAPTVPRPAQRVLVASPSRARRFFSLVSVCFVGMMVGVGLGFMVREGQARAAASASSNQNQAARSLHVADAHSVHVLVSLGPEAKAATPSPPRRAALRVATMKPNAPVLPPGPQASVDDFEPTFRVSP